jgi:hypothetical protein
MALFSVFTICTLIVVRRYIDEDSYGGLVYS